MAAAVYREIRRKRNGCGIKHSAVRTLAVRVLAALSALAMLIAAPAWAQQAIERVPFGEAIQRALARNSSVQLALQDVSRVHGIMREFFSILSEVGLRMK